jgi:hypothetical protein
LNFEAVGLLSIDGVVAGSALGAGRDRRVDDRLRALVEYTD